MEMLVTELSNKQVLDSYAGKKVFITGHTGFKGSWLMFMLHRTGAIIKGYSLPPTPENSLFNDLIDDLSIESVSGDIRDGEKLMREIISFQPDFIFHLAAQSLVRYSYHNPSETFEVNVMGTVHLLEAVRALSHPCATIVVTTDKVYENNESGKPFKESDPLGGYDPYSSSKAATEIVTQSYLRSWFAQSDAQAVATARAGNVIGGGDRAADRIIPDLVRSLEKNDTLIVRNPHAIRPWQHVLDPLSGYLKLALLLKSDKNTYQGNYNFGPLPDDKLTVKEIVELAISFWGSGKYETPPLENQLHEAINLSLDISKATDKLNWKPIWNAKEAVEKSVEWYRKLHNTEFNSKQLCEIDVLSFYTN